MTGTPIGEEREYWIQFDVEKGGKVISGTRIKISRSMEKDMHAKFSINLCEDPLYGALCTYVAANPPKDPQ